MKHKNNDQHLDQGFPCMQQNPQEQLIPSSSLIWKRWRCFLADELHTEAPNEGCQLRVLCLLPQERPMALLSWTGLNSYLPWVSFLKCVLLFVTFGFKWQLFYHPDRVVSQEEVKKLPSNWTLSPWKLLRLGWDLAFTMCWKVQFVRCRLVEGQGLGS